MTGDMVPHIPTSDFHEKNLSIIKHLLNLCERDAVTRRVFWSWIRQEAAA